ncbi:BOLL: Protein boule-like [Crotalus adamanteus]|uniref:BOLL: Protein boule-like n=1 Tax=Crotalus adamanteus TaxID=8729 RepID=A0AAW1BBZ1_CROAD
MQSTLLSIQETMLKIQETISKNHVEMRGDINKLVNRVEMIQQTMEKNEARIQSVEVGLDNVVKKVDILHITYIVHIKQLHRKYLEFPKLGSLYTTLVEQKQRE